MSGLITPSLDEMRDNLLEFEKNGIKAPVLVGGATTSKIHTAVKLADGYQGFVCQVGDASLVANVCGQLSNPEYKEKFIFKKNLSKKNYDKNSDLSQKICCLFLKVKISHCK